MTSIRTRLLSKKDKHKITFGNDESLAIDSGYTPNHTIGRSKPQGLLDYIADSEIAPGSPERPGDGMVYPHKDPGNKVMNVGFGTQAWIRKEKVAKEGIPEAEAKSKLGRDLSSARHHARRLVTPFKWENMTTRNQDIATEFVHSSGSGKGTGFPKKYPNLKRALEENDDEDIFLESRRPYKRRNILFYERYYGVPRPKGYK